MVEITINIRKSVEQNASDYFDKSKKLRKKIDGVKKAVALYEKKLADLKEKQVLELEKAVQQAKPKREKQWYEKFHWFVSSDGFLVVAGRDATTNEIVVKKHAEKNDLILHTEMAGSPFAVIRSENKQVGEQTINEAAEECAIYSRAWKLGIVPEVFWVKPEQVTKETKAGEFVPHGAFMVYGRKNFVRNIEMKMAIGVKEGRVIGGPVSAVKRHAEKFVVVLQGEVKKSDLAKQIQKRIGGDLDDILAFLPGDGKIEK